MTRHLTPIQVCQRLIGRPEEISLVCGFQEKAAYHWRNASKSRDAGDLPSARVMRALLAHAAVKNLGLTADHLIWGATEDEVQAILDARTAPAEFQHRVAAE
jgi:major membrane immunogen (membrane-anchored lipoprotein)